MGKYTFDEAVTYIANQSIFLNKKELTYGGNGYPSFRGESRVAIYGFDVNDFDEMNKLANEVGGTIEIIHWRNGWQLAESLGNAWEPFKLTTEDFGDNYSFFNPMEDFAFLKECINDCNNINEINNIISNYNYIIELYDIKDADEEVVLYNGEYWNTINTITMEYSFDTHNYAIAIVINSKNF